MKDAAPLPLETEIAVCGAGLAGLSAAYALARCGREVLVLEREGAVGGLARTLEHRGQRFDLGGHRLLSASARVDALVCECLREPPLRVRRSSKILLGGRYVEYPLRPGDALRGLGPRATLRALAGWGGAQLGALLRPRAPETLEDWIVRHYGRPLYELFFRPYTEKLWGLPCARISADWAAQRIQGMTLGAALRHALGAAERAAPRTLAVEFLYPARGIGEIAEGLRAAIEPRGRVRTHACVTELVHRGGRIESLAVRSGGRTSRCRAQAVISSLPLPALVRRLSPPPPEPVLAAAACLRYRDLVLVAVRLARERATDLTWIYIPERGTAIGRVHEPKNWSPAMGESGRTLLVAEHFCSRGDALWRAQDGVLFERTAGELAALGLARRAEVLDGLVVRVRCAYPVLEVGYAEACRTLEDYLGRFTNLHVVGRTGAFRYWNLDRAIESGLDAAQSLLGASSARAPVARTGSDP